MRLSLRGLAFLSLVVAFSACDGVSVFDALDRPPVVKTQVASAPPGSVMSLLLINESRKTWEYGACSYQIDRREAGAWVMVYDSRAGGCTLEAYSLRAGERRSRPVSLPSEEGAYRIRFRFQHFPRNVLEEVWVTSNTFEINAAPLSQ